MIAPPASIVALSFRGGWDLGDIASLCLGEAREGETADYQDHRHHGSENCSCALAFHISAGCHEVAIFSGPQGAHCVQEDGRSNGVAIVCDSVVSSEDE
jgi:hypothetical protein